MVLLLKPINNPILVSKVRDATQLIVVSEFESRKRDREGDRQRRVEVLGESWVSSSPPLHSATFSDAGRGGEGCLAPSKHCPGEYTSGVKGSRHKKK